MTTLDKEHEGDWPIAVEISDPINVRIYLLPIKYSIGDNLTVYSTSETFHRNDLNTWWVILDEINVSGIAWRDLTLMERVEHALKIPAALPDVYNVRRTWFELAAALEERIYGDRWQRVEWCARLKALTPLMKDTGYADYINESVNHHRHWHSREMHHGEVI